MKQVLSVLLFFVLLVAGCLSGENPAPTTSTILEETTSTTGSTTSTSSSSTTQETTTSTLGPQCLSDVDCGIGGWCRTGVCCGSYDSCGYKGECYRHDYMREDGYRCLNGGWVTKPPLTTSTTSTTSSTTTWAVKKKADGEGCYFDSECASGDCMADVCCSSGQCGFDGKCYVAGEKRADGRFCQANGSWKKPKGASCFGDGDCVTGYCEDNVCCNYDECGLGLIGKCFEVGESTPEKDRICFSASGKEVRWGKIVGSACTRGFECSTENCADGFCCYRNSCGYMGQCFGSGSEIVDYGKCVNGTWKD